MDSRFQSFKEGYNPISDSGLIVLTYILCLGHRVAVESYSKKIKKN